MTDSFKCIAELDLGPQAAAASTADTMQMMVREVLAAGDSCVVLKDEIVTNSGNSPMWEQLDTKLNFCRGDLKKLERLARKGYRLAVVLQDVEKVLRILESNGYERCAGTSLGAASLIDGWAGWFQQHFPDVQGALVFGHDFDPIFIFENSSAAA